MFLLDTNVVSELRRPERADRNVVTWAGSVGAASIFLSAISILEIELGVLRIERKDSAQGKILRAWIDDQICRVLRAVSSRSIPPWHSAARVFMFQIGEANATP